MSLIMVNSRMQNDNTTGNTPPCGWRLETEERLLQDFIEKSGHITKEWISFTQGDQKSVTFL